MTSRRELVFLVRMWSEGQDHDAGGWRGSVRDVASGTTLFVAAPREIADFISLRLGRPVPATADDRP